MANGDVRDSAATPDLSPLEHRPERVVAYTSDGRQFPLDSKLVDLLLQFYRRRAIPAEYMPWMVVPLGTAYAYSLGSRNARTRADSAEAVAIFKAQVDTIPSESPAGKYLHLLYQLAVQLGEGIVARSVRFTESKAELDRRYNRRQSDYALGRVLAEVLKVAGRLAWIAGASTIVYGLLNYFFGVKIGSGTPTQNLTTLAVSLFVGTLVGASFRWFWVRWVNTRLDQMYDHELMQLRLELRAGKRKEYQAAKEMAYTAFRELTGQTPRVSKMMDAICNGGADDDEDGGVRRRRRVRPKSRWEAIQIAFQEWVEATKALFRAANDPTF